MGSGRPANGIKYGGRTKGTPNKKTSEAQIRAERVLKLIEDDYLDDDIKKLNADQRTKLYVDMMEYVVPKLARVAHEGSTDTNLTIRIVRGNTKS